MEELVKRINELARKAKTTGLTPEETAERLALREEYLADWRRGTLETLENVYIIGEDGKEHKLPKKKF